MLLIFLSSGLFLGWSLGANDAANVFGTAVGTKMIRFKTAAIICGIFVILGAVLGGAGAAHTLGKLGSVNAIAGSFMVAFSAAFTVFWMTKIKVPVSTSQAVVGAIIGWNFFTGSLTDYESLTKIVLTWIVCPILAALFSIVLFSIFKAFFNRVKLHLLKLDLYTRIGLVLVGAFGSYSLGANNIANVMGVFVPVAPFDTLNVFGLFSLSSAQQLFLLGSLAIAVGVYTYSKRVMETVGGSLLKLSPEAALVVVLSQALVLFLFSSEGLENWLISYGLPTIPLVPVSSSQAVIGAVIGIGLLKGGKGIKE
jgi:PiT family inorganic phosphate transporter